MSPEKLVAKCQHICATCIHADEFIFCGKSGCAEGRTDMWEAVTEGNEDEIVIEIAIFHKKKQCRG